MGKIIIILGVLIIGIIIMASLYQLFLFFIKFFKSYTNLPKK